MQNNHVRREPSKREKGQTIVEFALVIGLIFLVVFGVVEFSRLFFGYATMSHGTREAARYGVVHPGDTTAIVEVAESAIFLLDGTVIVDVAYPDGALPGGPYCPHVCRVVITATSTYDAWTPLVPDFEMVAQATMHFE